MDIENNEHSKFTNLGRINIILGKNGCGKSTLLREMQPKRILQGELAQPLGLIEYLNPERGGNLRYQTSVENSMSTDKEWASRSRDQNEVNNLREQSVSRYIALETLVLRAVQEAYKTKTDGEMTFDQYVEKINSLLEEIRIESRDKGFGIFSRATGNRIDEQSISSGEKELITIAIEVLTFGSRIEPGKTNVFYLDEPDVHLHPDLQVKLMHFLRDEAEAHNFSIVLATHSTAVLGALEDYSHTHIAFMSSGEKVLHFRPINEIYRKILPVFGAHPLSNLFNEAPVLLVEGEDDERIWQRVVRSSGKKVRLYPCACGSKDQINMFEKEVAAIIKAVYDNAKAYSLRDGDDLIDTSIEDAPPVTKFRLQCYEAENLLLTDDVLAQFGFDWESFKGRMDEWIVSEGVGRNDHALMLEFQSSGYNRRAFKVKDLRSAFVYLLETPKAWEMIVGQTIAKIEWDESTDFKKEGSIYQFLGEKIVKTILPKSS